MKGFSQHVIDGPKGPIAWSQAGSGTPVVLLHGFPQTRQMWHAIAPELAKTYRVVCPDLRGYGASAKPQGTENFTFREMGRDILALMDHIGIERTHLVGHDRGARVSHRLALDAPERFASLTLMDIIPTHTLLRDLPHDVARGYYHWFFLAQPAPLPETMIAADPDFYFESCLTGWGTGQEPPFEPEALASYRNSWRNKETIRTMCEDYRAGVTLDFDIDQSDLGKTVTCPALVLYGAGGLMDRAFDMQAVWRDKLDAFTCSGIPGGHFFPDHAPRETLEALLPFLSAVSPDAAA